MPKDTKNVPDLAGVAARAQKAINSMPAWMQASMRAHRVTCTPSTPEQEKEKEEFERIWHNW